MTDEKVSSNSRKDTIYASHKTALAPFDFNQNVVDVFPDMISRSVPGYRDIIIGISDLCFKWLHTNHMAQAPVHIYDLGCSLGAVSLSLANKLAEYPILITGIDNSEAMVERCKIHIKNVNFGSCIQIRKADLIDFNYESSDIIVLNFTLQFIEPSKRQSLINTLFKSLKPNGILIVSEKIKFKYDRLEHLITELHDDFKRNNGYSELEISQKRSALENVMILDTLEDHLDRFTQAGFSESSVWHQALNFASMVAIK